MQMCTLSLVVALLREAALNSRKPTESFSTEHKASLVLVIELKLVSAKPPADVSEKHLVLHQLGLYSDANCVHLVPVKATSWY